MRNSLLLILMSSAVLCAQTSPLSPEQRATFHGQMSQPVEPFRIVGNIYYVGARNIASYLITTPEGNIMIDTGTKEMHQVILTNLAKLGFKPQDIKILLSGHAHFDHVQGHAAMQKATGAKVMALGPDAAALSAGMDKSPLGDEGWEPVKVDRVLKDGDTVSLGGTTLRAVWTPGHTPGCTTWTTNVQEKGKPYSIVFQACGAPNAGVKLSGNTLFPTLVEDTLRSFGIQKNLKADMYLPMHPESYFAGKVERIKAGETPHPLYDPQAYAAFVAQTEADFRKRAQQPAGKEFGYAVKKPIFGGSDATGPWGVLGTFVKEAMKNSGWDIQLCRTCAGGPRAARLVSAAAIPPKPAAGRPNPGTPDAPLDFGATGAQFLWWAYQGTHDFKQDPGVPRKNLRMIANIQDPSYMLFGVKADSGITDLKEIKEKRLPVRVLATAQGGDTIAAILAYYGLTKEALESWGGKLLGNRPEDRKDVDVMIGFGAMVRPEYDPWIDVSQRLDIKFLEVPEDLRTKLITEYDLQEVTIPEGLLRGVDREMRGVGRTGDVVYGRDDMPNDFAYALAKNIDEHKDLLQWLIVPFSYNSQNVWKTFGVPLHPGAARYYREKGYMK